jgi:hypothetical protein
VSVWPAASVVFFLYVAGVALLVARLSSRRLYGVIAGVALALIITRLLSIQPSQPFLQDWIVPPALLLLGYWTSGLLFVSPMPRMERALLAVDDALAVATAARRTPRWLAEVLEIAYAGVYPLIPIALILQVIFSPDPNPLRFWSVILITDYICFGMLPWVQTRPPRALEARDPWTASFRRINLHLLGSASIGVNTFPSGHAAEAIAAALLVIDGPWFVVATMFTAAIAVTAGAVLGRYHYAADAIAGWVVAMLIWTVVR